MYAHYIRQEVYIVDMKKKWYSSNPTKCASGIDIIKWVKEHLDNDEKNAMEIC